MAHYILSFTVYTLAMSGLIFFALFVYKKVVQGNIGTKNSKMLSVEETMSISPRKTLMIVKAGDERFLIASDIDKTTLISKLNNNENSKKDLLQMANINSQIKQYEDFKNIEHESIDLGTLANKSVENEEILNKLIKNESIDNNFSENKDVYSSQEPVHLEIINDRNTRISELRKTQRERKGKRNVSIDDRNSKNSRFATIKEMINKVNEI